MIELAGEGLLWGNWPLGLLLGAWTAIVALVGPRAPYVSLGYATGAGVLFGISLAPYGAIWAPVLGFAALLQFVDRAALAGMRKRAVFGYAYHAMVLFNVLATWWVANTALAAGIVANFLNAAFQALIVLLVYQLRRQMPKVWQAGAIALWIGFEYLHFNWEIAWPWLCLGHTFAAAPALAQWFEYTGVFGGSLYVTLGGALVARQLRYARQESTAGLEIAPRRALPSVRELASLALVLLVPMVWSLIAFAWAAPTAAGEVVRVGVVQPNYEPHYEKFSVSDAEQLERFRGLTDSALAAGAQLVVWPETSFGGVEESQFAREPWHESWREASRSALRQNASPAGLLAGLSTYRVYDDDHGQPALRTQVGPGGRTAYYSAHNTAVAVADTGVTAVYHKSKLVPGVEFLPYRRALFMFDPLVESLGGTTVGLGKSDAALVFDYAIGARAAPLICYESLYGDYVREFVRAGANLLVVPTNDGWWDDSPGHRQHFNLARLRAIETRRWVVQAANSGTSGIIDARGRAMARTGYGVPAVLTHDVRLLDGETFYVRYGDVLGRVAAGGSLLLLLTLLVRALQPKGRGDLA